MHMYLLSALIAIVVAVAVLSTLACGARFDPPLAPVWPRDSRGPPAAGHGSGTAQQRAWRPDNGVGRPGADGASEGPRRGADIGSYDKRASGFALLTGAKSGVTVIAIGDPETAQNKRLMDLMAKL
jgi:hypothetical protein